MNNLLANALTKDGVAARLRPSRPALPSLEADMWKQAARNPLARALFAPLQDMARQERQQPLPPFTDALYADFQRTGRRIAFENVYFRRRRMLARAAQSVLLEQDTPSEAAHASFVEKLRGIFSEESWALPAHVRSPTGKDPLALDLFAAETANLMGEMLAVFGPVLPESFTQQIRDRLRKTIFENYIDNHETLGWTHSYNNWNAVCHQGILGAALSAQEDPALVARLLTVARTHLPRFLEGFGADGGSSEGPGYWQYGFGWFSMLNEQLETASGNTLSLFEGDPHVHEIARFYPRATFRNNYQVNFSDCRAQEKVNPRLLSYLGTRLDDSLLRAAGNNAWRALVQNGLELEELRGDFFYLARLLRDCPAEMPAEVALPHTEFFFHDLQVLTASRQDVADHLWEFAAKGGHNAEHHNHNDCGSYILHIDGQPFVTEIGSPEYNKAFFSERRYENLAARTLGHSLPLINGQEQSVGRKHAARILAHELMPNAVRFVADLTACYPEQAQCKKLIRTFLLDSTIGILSVTDEYELSEAGAIETAIVTNQQIEKNEQGVCIVSSGTRLWLHSAANMQMSEVTEHVYRDCHAQNASVRRIVMKPDVLAQSGSLGYCFSLH